MNKTARFIYNMLTYFGFTCMGIFLGTIFAYGLCWCLISGVIISLGIAALATLQKHREEKWANELP